MVSGTIDPGNSQTHAVAYALAYAMACHGVCHGIGLATTMSDSSRDHGKFQGSLRELRSYISEASTDEFKLPHALECPVPSD